MTEVLAPERIISTRWRCPYCPRSRSSKTAVIEHMGRCWYNPEVRSCKTCANFEPAYGPEPDTGYGYPEGCAAGVDLDTGEPFSALPVGCAKWEATDAA